MSVLDVRKSTIANPFVSESVATSWFSDLKNTAGSTTPIDRTILLLSDSTGNQPEEWYGIGLTAMLAAIPNVRCVYSTFNDGTTSWPATPTVLQAGVPVGSPTPVSGVVASDDGSGSGELVGSTSSGGQVWTGSTGYQARSGGKITSTGAGLFDSQMPIYAKGDVTYTANWGISNQEVSSKQYRVMIRVDANNYCRINVVGTTTKTITLTVALAGVSRTVATFTSGAVPANAAYAEYAMSLGYTITKTGSTITGGTLSGTVNSTNASGALTADEATMLAAAEFITYGSNSATGTIDAISVSCVGVSTFGPYRTLHIYNAAVPGTTLDYQTSNANASRRTVILSCAPEVLVVAEGHNYALDDPTTFQGKIETGIGLAKANQASIASVIVASQNPEFVGSQADAPKVAAHGARQLSIRQWALSKGWGYVPGYEPFASRHDGGQSLIDSTGVHPTFAGTLAQGNGSMQWGDTWAQYLAGKLAAAT